MFCNKCGGELPPDKVLCPHCGVQIPPAAIRFSAATAPAPAPVPWLPQEVFKDKHAQLRREHPELQGVGGWLSFFAWINLVVAPLVFATQASFNTTAVVDWIVFGSLRLYGAVVGYLILDESRYALTNAFVQLGIQLAISTLLVGLQFAYRQEPSVLNVRLALNSALWLVYFFVSRRVKLTLDPPPPNHQK